MDNTGRSVLVRAEAALVAGKVEVFKAKMRELNPEIRFDHCSIHHEATAANTLPAVLNPLKTKLV
jgi:hypothetical protein